MTRLLLSALLAGTIPAAALLADPSGAQAAETLPFQTHAEFFSHETKQPVPIDPQVFVADPAAPEATGPQGIKHAAGYRPAKIDGDARSLPVSDASGKALGFTLGSWLGATGQASIAKAGSGETVTATFHGLVPRAQYSLFENHFDRQPVGFTPLDGKGTSNSFTTDAKGDATVTVTVPQAMTHANAVLLVYHSDGQAHGESRGEIGVTAHHQLIARIPGA